MTATINTAPEPVVTAAVNGDREAFGRLWTQHSGAVFRFVLNRVEDRNLAEDLTSYTFFLALRVIHRFNPADGRPILARLFTIARNRIGEHRGAT
jgi:RNA polymerase sigma-70 factor, ECF subfamily